MRDPNRIDTVLNEIRRYWERNPDLRLAQVVGNAASRAGYGGGGYGMEDDTLLNHLRPLPLEHPFAFAGDQTERLDHLIELLDNVGRTLTFTMAGVTTETIPAWTSGKAAIPDAEARRLRTGVQALRTVVHADGINVAQMWFTGANPWLGDDTVVNSIRLDKHDQVLRAARAQADGSFSG